MLTRINYNHAVINGFFFVFIIVLLGYNVSMIYLCFRPSSEHLANALEEGICAAGGNSQNFGK